MVALKIEDIKTCTAKLFLGEEFDSFLVREAQIVTFNSFTIWAYPKRILYRSGIRRKADRTLILLEGSSPILLFTD